VLLDGNRHAITGALLTLVFAALVILGTVWTFEMQRLLTETDSVQTLLNTLLSGIILLVSVVVSINSLVLSHDITSLGQQQDRIENARQYRRDLGQVSDSDRSPTHPNMFLHAMADVIRQRALALHSAAEDMDDAECATKISEYAQQVADDVDTLEERLTEMNNAGFAPLWLGMSYDHGTYMNRTREINLTYRERLSEEVTDRLDELAYTHEIFATGKEYFKTLYYVKEFSQLSQTLLLISLPTIVSDVAIILSIDAGLIPEVWLFGIPPLTVFVSGAFAVSLIPYIVLTAFMLRVATVAKRTNSAGPFTFQQ